MKQAVLLGKGGPWDVRDVPIPRPGPGQVLIKMHNCSICNQTDLNTIRALHPPHDHQQYGMLPHHFRIWDKRVPDELSDVYPARSYRREPFPTTMGHEGMGTIVEMGPQLPMDEDWIFMGESASFKIGDRVSLLGTFGGFGEYVVSASNELVKVPDHVSDNEASLFEPVCIINNVVRQVANMNGTMLILGQGALGLLATQIAKIYGVNRIITSEPFEFKRTLSKQFGADVTLDPATQNIVREVEVLTNGKFVDCLMECAGEPETIRIIPYVAGLGCKIGQIGACCKPVLVDWSYIHFRGLNITSSPYTMLSDVEGMLRRGMEMTASGKLDLKSLITHHFKLDDVAQAFDLVGKGVVVKGMFDISE